MRTELLFESCPFLTSANVTLSRLGFADGDALWEIMQDEELYRYEYEAPAKERVQAEYKIQDANAQFAAKRTVTLGVYANTDLAHLIGWIEIGGADEGMNMVQLRFLFGRRCVGTEYPAEAMGALCRYLFEMARVNRVQSVCLDADIDKQRILEKSGFQREGVLRECHRWERQGVVNLAYYAMLLSDYNFLKNTRTVLAGAETTSQQQTTQTEELFFLATTDLHLCGAEPFGRFRLGLIFKIAIVDKALVLLGQRL